MQWVIHYLHSFPKVFSSSTTLPAPTISPGSFRISEDLLAPIITSSKSGNRLLLMYLMHSTTLFSRSKPKFKSSDEFCSCQIGSMLTHYFEHPILFTSEISLGLASQTLCSPKDSSPISLLFENRMHASGDTDSSGSCSRKNECL